MQETEKTWVQSWVGKIPWRRKLQPSSVFLTGKSHGRRSPVGYSPWGHKEADTTQHAHVRSVDARNWTRGSLRNGQTVTEAKPTLPSCDCQSIDLEAIRKIPQLYFIIGERMQLRKGEGRSFSHMASYRQRQTWISNSLSPYREFCLL